MICICIFGENKMKVCRICLSQDGRLYPIRSNGLHSLYHQLIGVVKLEDDVDKGMPQWVCAECGLRLMSYNKLRQKGLRSHQILTDLLNRVTHITVDDLNQIDREKYNLQSNLSHCVLEQGIVQENEVEIQETDKTDRKPILKIEEFVLDFEIDETLPIFNTERVSDECNSETAFSNSENISDCKSDVSDSENDSLSFHSDNLSSDSSTSINELMKSVMDILAKKPKPTKEIKKKVNKHKKTVKKQDSNPVEDIFTIQTLSLEEQIKEFEKRKHTKNYTDAAYKCNDCLTGFNNEVTFARHKLTHSDEWGKVVCNICKKRFRVQTTYRRHMRAHKIVYSCKECHFITRRSDLALAHKFQHNGKLFKCTQCDQEFVKRSSYLSHLRVKHVSQFVCEFCGFSFVSARGVRCHKNLIHSLEINNKVVPTDGPTCASCQIKFVSDDALDTHLQVSHAQNSDGKIRNSDKGQYYKNNGIICELCGKKTVDGKAYRIHLHRHHPNNGLTESPSNTEPTQLFDCDLCGLVYKTEAGLRIHESMHNAQTLYECDHCHKKFTLKQHIHKHILKNHLPNRPLKPKPKTSKPKTSKERYPCTVCGREFNIKSNRKRHMIVHTELRPFICDVCGSTFKSKAEVNLHTTHVHLKKPWPKKKK